MRSQVASLTAQLEASQFKLQSLLSASPGSLAEVEKEALAKQYQQHLTETVQQVQTQLHADMQKSQTEWQQQVQVHYTTEMQKKQTEWQLHFQQTVDSLQAQITGSSSAGSGTESWPPCEGSPAEIPFGAV